MRGTSVMHRWFVLFTVASSVSPAFAIFEDSEQIIEEVNNDPKLAQIAKFNDFTKNCMVEAQTNTKTVQDPVIFSCCFQDYWIHCMDRMPLLPECPVLLKERYNQVKDDLILGIDCIEVDMRACPHKAGHDEFVSGSEKRSARYTSASTAAIPVSITLIMLLVSFSATAWRAL